MQGKIFGPLGIILASIIGLIILVSLFIFLLLPRINPHPINIDVQNPAYINRFAQYEEIPVNVTLSVPIYTIQPDLSNITNYADFQGIFTGEGLMMLEKNCFVVIPSTWDEFFSLYENNRYDFVPNFVTVDSLLHNYHLVFNNLLEELETEQFIPTLKKLNSQLLSTALEQYKKAQKSPWEGAAKRNLAFIIVGNCLLEPKTEIFPSVKGEVETELALIKQSQGISPSPIMNSYSGQKIEAKSIYFEDYSQYIPRSHYNKTEDLKKYFRCMMWYGRINFVFSHSDNIKSAALLTLTLNQNNALPTWEKLFEPISFLVGKADDTTYYEMQALLSSVYGKDYSLEQLLKDTGKFTDLENKAKTFTPPQVNSIPIFYKKIQPDRAAAITGFRLMGQRFTIDAAIMQKLVYRDVDDRFLPKAMDVPAALGNDEALKILGEMGENKYPNYSENMQSLRTYSSGISKEVWTQNLYWSWLYTLLPLNQPKGTGFPSFMQNAAWARKEINSFLGSYTELKHDTILYSKQVCAEMGGAEPIEKDDRGYVEPNPWLFGRMASLVKMSKQGLANRGLLSDKTQKNLTIMEDLSLQLKVIAEKELNNQALSDKEYELIRSFGGQLEHLWMEIYKKEMGEENDQQSFLYENPAALVADIATDPNGQVLEEGIGKIFEIFVVVPIDGKLRLTKGGVFSYYEFTCPLSGRLTDQAWRGMLRQEEENVASMPSLPDWTKSFIFQR